MLINHIKTDSWSKKRERIGNLALEFCTEKSYYIIVFSNR